MVDPMETSPRRRERVFGTLAGKLGIDATTKIGSETRRDWGQAMALDPAHVARAADLLSGVLA